MRRHYHKNHQPDDPFIKVRGCLFWIVALLVFLLIFSKANKVHGQANRWLPDSHLNLTLDSVDWRDHNRHTIWLSNDAGDSILILHDWATMERPRYRIGGRYHIAWRGRDGDPCDKNNRLRFELSPGWRGTP